MKLRIKKKYKNSSDSYLLKLSNRVSVSLKENKSLPDPKPTQPELEKACQDFNEAVSLAGRNDRTLTSAKNDKKAVLIRLLDELADYVTVASKGDSTILLSSGFDIAGIKSDTPDELAPIEKVTVEGNEPGKATIRVKKVTGAKAYIHQYTPDPLTADSVWISETTTDRENTFNNLRSVAKYWFRVIAIGKGKQTVYSPPVSKVIE
jgi:hypothetical protein